MLPVPEASLPAVEICSDRSAAGISRSASADVVVRDEDDLEEGRGHRVGVDLRGHVVGELDDLLGEDVAGGGLAREDLHARDPPGAGIVADLLPERDGLEDVQVLALVFVDALDLDVEHRVGVGRETMRGGKPVRQPRLVRALHAGVAVEEARIVEMGFQLRQLFGITHPVVADGVGDEGREAGIAAQHPAAGRHAVRLVHDPVGVEAVEFGEDRLLHQVGVQRRDAVHPVRHDEGQIAHVDRAVADGGGAPVGVGAGVRLVDPVDDLHVARQEVAHQPLRPLLQRLWQERVVGVAEAAAGDLHRFVEGDATLVVEEADELGPRDGGVGVVELDRHLLGELPEIVELRLEPSDEIAERGGGEEVFLLEAERLAAFRRVVGVENAGDGAGERLGLGRRGVVAPVEAFEVEELGGQRAPEAERVGPAGLPADHGGVVGLRDHRLGRAPDGAGAGFVHVAAEADLEMSLGAFELPDVALDEPVLRRLDLAAVLEALAEEAVFVADAVAVGGRAERGEAFHEAGREPPEAAVAERGVGFVVDDLVEGETERAEGFARIVEEARVDHRVFEETPDQELHRQVVDPLVSRGVGRPRGFEPAVDDAVAHGEGEGHAPVVDACVVGVLALRIAKVREHRVAEGLGLGHGSTCLVMRFVSVIAYRSRTSF
jgi:hypothetical protein